MKKQEENRSLIFFKLEIENLILKLFSPALESRAEVRDELPEVRTMIFFN